MVKSRAGEWLSARSGGSSFTFALAALAVCGVLLLQPGCQQEATDASSPVVEAPPSQPAAPENATAVVPAARESRPAQNVPQESQLPQPQAVAGKPKIEFKTTEQNLGEIGPETSHTTKFEFKNVGTAPLEIKSIKPCCGSVTRGVKAGQVFAPGDSGALEVEYRTGTYPGALVRSISMDTNDPNQPDGIVSLRIRATVVYRIEHSPNRLNLFPRKENAGAAPITIKSTDGKPFSITGFRATANTLTADFDPNVKATEFVLKPKADVDKLVRNPKGQISVNLTHPECKNIFLPYDVLPEFSVTPSQLTLFNIKATQPVQREIWILSNYEEDFEVESVSSQRGTMKVVETNKIPGAAKLPGAVSDSGKTGTRYQLKVEITPPVLEDKRSILSDFLEIKLKGGETLTVQCRGFYAAS